MIFLEHFYPYLVAMHFIAALLLVKAAVHNLRSDYLCISRNCHQPSSPVSMLVMYTLAYILGALAYPTFRIRIRAEYFDKFLPWATRLFEIKEHFASFGLALAIAYVLLRKSRSSDNSKPLLLICFAISLFINLILLYQMLVGPYLVVLKGIK